MKCFLRKALFMLLTTLSLMSCSQDEQVSVKQSNLLTTSHKITVEEAKKNVMDFVSKLNQETRASSFWGVNIGTVEVVSIPNGTRSGIPVNLDSLFYIINFKDNKGFAIASSDDREVPIFALVEEGNYSYDNDTITNAGFEAFMSGLIEQKASCRESGLSYYVLEEPDMPSGGGDYPDDKFEMMAPLLATKWGQGAPYNKYCPGPYTGCVITAISQICSYLQTPNTIQYNIDGEAGATILDWLRINNECSKNNGELITNELEDHIAKLMRFWGGAFGAKYKAGGTSANTEDALKIMRGYGFNVSSLDEYDVNAVINDLKKGNRIVIMRGNGRYYHVGLVFRKYVDGHAWVVDGYIDQIKNRKETKYIHCNWGWNGLHNGYFLSTALNAEENPAYDDGIVSTRSSNFRYKLKTATFIK